MSTSMNIFRIGPVSVRWKSRPLMICCLLLAAILLLAVFHIATGTMSFSSFQVISSLVGGSDNATADRIIQRVRLPRLVTALFVGASLGMAGAIFQSISRNALGSPDVIGFTTGAATGAIAQIILFNAGPLETALSAVASGMAAAVLVFMLAVKGRRTGGYRLILVGIGVGAILSGINTVLLVAGDLDQAASAQLWLSGSLNTRSWAHVVPAMVGFAVTVPLALHYAKSVNILEMGDDAACQLGIQPERTRLAMVLVAVTLTSVATASAGPISFVALAAPQLARRLTASSNVPLISGALMGATLLVVADLLSQHVPFGIKMPIGLTTGLLGGLYLLWVLACQKK
ncbi:iron chelate uptake ABC transporter family permease subunit [Brucella intermedia]|uniref:ABC transporter permease n=6 Tax=Brucella intermedia TaxID=94625 RepID=U4VB75_9HYPH|nr:transport system permease protein [Brucella intermedia LMG 3301]ERM01899.1 ABC transporter permease [Brucella intermedia 229E]KAB2692931.1 iron chelate uptake ABC transporter family permease subunit [Brucella intermedia]OOC51041.1 ABC transporter permease [Brucella intermedia M86]PJT27738.1 Fe(3+)-siderophore ABC transporter permease [Ochrobactrum sp. 30A/1000/2015]PJT40565.1 Fe(3+)-siderophore ABC transporter permease [Ochrobactrum sp. 27A/999/2015]PJT42798.1 Fe(3+)-siderophore ABC transp